MSAMVIHAIVNIQPRVGTDSLDLDSIKEQQRALKWLPVWFTIAILIAWNIAKQILYLKYSLQLRKLVFVG